MSGWAGALVGVRGRVGKSEQDKVMFVDAITLAAVADEWRTLLVGARIDTIIQPTEHAVAIQCYTPGAGASDSPQTRQNCQ